MQIAAPWICGRGGEETGRILPNADWLPVGEVTDERQSGIVKSVTRIDDVKGKIAIVTGGGSGIGEALSKELAKRGAHVVVADVDFASADRVGRSIAAAGGHAEARRTDVSSEREVRDLIEQVAAKYGQLDYLFNNAGIAIGGDARDLTPEQWRRVLDVDLYGVLYGTLAAYPVMVGQGFGHIVNVASVTGLVPQPINAPYATAKHGVVGLSLSLRLEGVDLGVRVSVVCPGYVKTNIYENVELVGVDRAVVTRSPIRGIDATKAAGVILDGVARNQSVIVFPGVFRWAWRAYRLVPSLADRVMLPRVRQLRSSRPHP